MRKEDKPGKSENLPADSSGELSAGEIEQILREHDSWFEQLAEYDKVK